MVKRSLPKGSCVRQQVSEGAASSIKILLPAVFAGVAVVMGIYWVCNCGGNIPMLSTTVGLEQDGEGSGAGDYPPIQTLEIKEDAEPVLTQQTDSQQAEDQASPEQWQTVRMKVTGYCACPKCCGKSADGITASLHKISRGDVFVAADRRYSFGTELIVPGYNDDMPVKVLDRGGAIKGNKLDLFFDTHQKARQWGVKYLDVKVRI